MSLSDVYFTAWEFTWNVLFDQNVHLKQYRQHETTKIIYHLILFTTAIKKHTVAACFDIIKVLVMTNITQSSM